MERGTARLEGEVLTRPALHPSIRSARLVER